MWTLVIMIFLSGGHGVTIDHIDDFPTRNACMRAGTVVKSSVKSSNLIVVRCITKELS